jgi:hypothetical protein
VMLAPSGDRASRSSTLSPRASDWISVIVVYYTTRLCHAQQTNTGFF